MTGQENVSDLNFNTGLTFNAKQFSNTFIVSQNLPF